jgi:hypothetical protein
MWEVYHAGKCPFTSPLSPARETAVATVPSFATPVSAAIHFPMLAPKKQQMWMSVAEAKKTLEDRKRKNEDTENFPPAKTLANSSSNLPPATTRKLDLAEEITGYRSPRSISPPPLSRKPLSTLCDSNSYTGTNIFGITTTFNTMPTRPTTIDQHPGIGNRSIFLERNKAMEFPSQIPQTSQTQSWGTILLSPKKEPVDYTVPLTVETIDIKAMMFADDLITSTFGKY